MRKFGIGSRILAALMALVTVLSLVPALQPEANAASSGNMTVKSEGHGMGLTSSDKITMPIKIMDFESDGMFFDYLFGRAVGSLTSHAQYEPEGIYWLDYTDTLYAGKQSGSVRVGSGIDAAAINSAGAKEWGNLSMTVSFTSLGGKQVLDITRTMTGDVPLSWNIASFGDAGVAVSDIRYVAITYIDFTRAAGSGAPKMGISSALDDDGSKRYATGNFSNWYYLDPGQVGEWGMEVAVIDLHDGGSGKGMPLNKVVKDLYLDFPMGPNDNQRFMIAGVGCFDNYGDAEQFGYWAASAGSMSDAAEGTYLKTGNTECVDIPADHFDNDNRGFSMLVPTKNNTFGTVSSIGDYIAAQTTTTAGQQPLFISGKVDLWDAKDSPYSGTAMKWANNATSVDITTAIGYTLFQTIGDTQRSGYATVGLVESSLDENGLPVYKESVLNYMQTFLRNRLVNCLDREYDGWMYYSSIRGARNGEIFGYMDGGQKDMDPTREGVQGVPMDFATAICEHFGINRNARDINGKTDRNRGKVGSYAATMSKRKYLEGSWLDCKQYINNWWDLAYYMMHNFWVPNSYNQLQSEYNYLNLYKSTNANSTSYGHYVFDSKLTKVNSSPYTSAVTYDKNNKTIGHAGAGYQTYFSGNEAYNPFTPVNYGNGKAGESTNNYYFDDGVNAYSAFGGNLWYDNKNYGYSLVCNGEFDFKKSSNLMFHFDGDDDVYLFINGELVMDLGATHNNTASTIYLNNYVNWADDVLANRRNHTLAEVARAEKLALKDDQTYSFDFYYMERHGTGANLRIETNINVVVPELEVNKVASQDGVEVPDNGVVDNSKPVEYGFSLTNDDDTSKLYNISFLDSTIGVELTPEKGLVVKNTGRVKNSTGGTLQASDLVAYVDGYDGDPSRPRTKKLDTITVRFRNNEELKQFLTNLSSDDGTDAGASDSLYSGDGLWAFATVTVRGIYYTQTLNEQGNASFTNPVTAYAYNGAYRLTGKDTHTVYAFGEPAYFQWAGEDHKIVISAEKLYHDLRNSKTYKDKNIPQPGHMVLTLCDAQGNPVDYEHVSNVPGGDVYLEVHYPDPGLYTVYMNIQDQTGVYETFTLALVFYVMDVEDSAVVLDYGLTADLTHGITEGKADAVNLPGKETLNTVMAITGVTAKPSYVERDVSEVYQQISAPNGITMLDGTGVTAYRGQLDAPVYLKHDVPWIIDWETTGSTGECLLFSLNEVGSVADNLYLFLRDRAVDNTTYPDFVALGRYHNGAYDNHGVSLNAAGKNMNTAQKYRLLNRPFTDGTNKVILYVAEPGSDSYAEVGELNTWWINGTLQTQASTFISGKDFTFNYIGTTGHPVNLTNLKSVTVYEQGLEQTNYRWEYKDGKVQAVATAEPGNVVNTNAWKASTTAEDTDGFYGALSQWVELSSEKEWVIEFTLSGIYEADDPRNVDQKTGEVMLMSSYHTSEHEYLFLKADAGLVCFGTSDAAGYHNYGIGLKSVIPGFSMADEHTYRIEHRIHTDGTSMAYLIVDGTEVGPMVNSFSGSEAVEGMTGDMFTGNNLMFCYLGYNKGHWPIDCQLKYLQVWEDTSLNGTFGWVKEGGKLVDVYRTDNSGNRIHFPGDSENGLIDSKGTIEGQEGTFGFEGGKLTFTPNTFLEGGINTVKVALTVHDRDFVPTPLKDQYVDVANEVQMYKNITVIPATVVYYEDSFPSIKYVSAAGENRFTVINGSTQNLEQNSCQNTNYGSDNAYVISKDQISGDSVHKIKIDAANLVQKDGTQIPVAYFRFTGTGFELISRANAVDYASIFIRIYEGDVTFNEKGAVASGTVKTVVPIITQFDNRNNLGAEEVYQVPVVRWESGEDAANYTAVIYGIPANRYDDAGKVTSTQTTWLYVDGLRIYQPIGASHTGYRDVENNAIFTEVREEIVAGNFAAANYNNDGVSIGSGLTVFTENLNGEFVGSKVQYVNDYLMAGPKNEVYMDGTFTQSALLIQVKEENAAVHDLQIGVHALDYGQFLGAGYTGLGAVLAYSVSDGSGYVWKTLTTLQGMAEQYYTVPYTECPLVDGCYQVALRILPLEEDIPALAAFTGVKTNGLCLVPFGRESGSLGGNIWLGNARSMVMSNALYTGNESAPGGSFLPGTGADANGPTVTPLYPSLSFEDEIKYNIYFTVSNLGSFTTEDLGLAVFADANAAGTVSEAVERIGGAELRDGKYVLQTNGISPKNLGDKLFFKVYAKLADGSYVYSDLYSYSALDYAREQLQTASNTKLKQLMVAMLNYGAAAQTYFGYRTDEMMNGFLLDGDLGSVDGYRSDMLQALPAVDAAKAGAFGSNVGGFSRKYPSVTFGGAFAINYYFTPANKTDTVTFYYWTEEAFDSAEVLTQHNATGKTTVSASANGSFAASVSGIAARNIGDTVYVAAVYEAAGVTYSTGILTYSLGAYCAANAAAGSANMRAFAAATAVYGYYAENYFGA